MTPCRSNNSTSPLPSPIHSCLAEAPMQSMIWEGEAGQEHGQEEKPSLTKDVVRMYWYCLLYDYVQLRKGINHGCFSPPDGVAKAKKCETACFFTFGIREKFSDPI
ncbi:hypothetical protein AVEN_235187-1 [Araneus ventricosus]|uniref:Uncharacterized protein n=1 Tax=Araneus ventricosus TaxID=182803 RepID=A0A4Y2LY34_ARAVE|nr:hypothetical protein AVEN_235187-1 [Araneus ventricosus]